MASGLTDFPLLQDIAELLPYGANERSVALHNINEALTEYIVRVTDACIEKALKKKHPLQSALKHERSVMVRGRLTPLQTMKRPELHQWLVSRGIVPTGTKTCVALQELAIRYVVGCKKKLAENTKQPHVLLIST